MVSDVGAFASLAIDEPNIISANRHKPELGKVTNFWYRYGEKIRIPQTISQARYTYSIVVSGPCDRVGIIRDDARFVKFLRNLQKVPADVRKFPTIGDVYRSAITVNVVLAFSDLVVLRLFR